MPFKEQYSQSIREARENIQRLQWQLEKLEERSSLLPATQVVLSQDGTGDSALDRRSLLELLYSGSYDESFFSIRRFIREALKAGEIERSRGFNGEEYAITSRTWRRLGLA